MQYQVPEVNKYKDAPVLALTRQEAKCVESLTNLSVGESVIVLYIGEVVVPYDFHPADSPVGVILAQPIIVRKSVFNTFAERFMDFIAENPETNVVPSATGVVPVDSAVKAS
jgi:hypothetical protein